MPNLSEDQELETGDPIVGNDDVAEQFAAMQEGEPPEHIVTDELEAEESEEQLAEADATPEVSEESEGEEAEAEAEVEAEAEAEEQPEDTPEDELEVDERELALELQRYREEEIARLRAENESLKSLRQSQEAKGPTKFAPGTVGAIAQPYRPDPEQFMEDLQDRWLIGIAPGETPATAYQAVFGVEGNEDQVQAFNAVLNRSTRAAVRTILSIFPALFDGGMQSAIDKVQLEDAFWQANKDLDDAKPIVVALSEQLKASKPHLTQAEYIAELGALVRKQLKRPRPSVKSGGTVRRNTPQAGGKQKPALAGGTGPRKAPRAQKSGLDREFQDFAGSADELPPEVRKALYG